MKDITIKELVDMVEADVPDSEVRIQKMFEWYFERDMTITKWLLGAAASISVAVIVALLKEEVKIEWWQTMLIICSAAASFAYGMYRLRQIRNVHRQFVSALKLYRELKSIAPFIGTYRQAIK